MEGMEAKQGRYSGRPPKSAGDPLQHKKQKPGICQMEYDVGEMMPSRVESENLDIKHMREPGHGMPVGRMPRGERPEHPVPCQAGLHMTVLGHVEWVVIAYEIMVGRLPVHSQRDPGQEQVYY
jgi:hypothetical protein